MKFNCTGCGACCLDVAGMLPAKPDRSCVNLGADRKTCLVYETRPLICRVDATKPAAFTLSQWRALNERACVTLREHYGIPEVEECRSPSSTP